MALRATKGQGRAGDSPALCPASGELRSRGKLKHAPPSTQLQRQATIKQGLLLRPLATRNDDLPPAIHCAHDVLEILAKQIQPFAPDQELLPGIRSISLPGHTPGQSGYLFQSADSQLMVIGDAMHDPLLHVQHPEWTSMGDARRQQTVKTRRELLARLADQKLRFQAFHFPFPESVISAEMAPIGLNLCRSAGHGRKTNDR